MRLTLVFKYIFCTYWYIITNRMRDKIMQVGVMVLRYFILITKYIVHFVSCFLAATPSLFGSLILFGQCSNIRAHASLHQPVVVVSGSRIISVRFQCDSK